MSALRSGLAAAVLALPGHEDLAEDILSHLDWKSILAAGGTCQVMNSVVRTSTRLQLCLRAAFYSLPPGYLNFDRGTFENSAPFRQRLDRMIDVFRRWSICSPVTAHRIGAPQDVLYAVSNGLVAAAGCRINHHKLHWNDDLHPAEFCDPNLRIGPGAWPSSWAVFDVHHLREADLNPAGLVAKWTMNANHCFQDIDINREENVVATITARLKRVKTGWTVHMKVHCYILEPTDEFAWAEGAMLRAKRHPDAANVVIVRPLVLEDGENLEPYDNDMMYPCQIRLGSNGSVHLQPRGSRYQLLWDWRKGKTIMQVGPLDGGWDSQPIAGRGLLSVGSLYQMGPNGTPADIDGFVAKHYNTTEVSVHETQTPLPSPDMPIHTAKYSVTTDHAAKLATYTVSVLAEFPYITPTYVLTELLGRPSEGGHQLDERERKDIRFYEHGVWTAVCGHRTATLELASANLNPRSFLEFGLHVADYRFSTPDADVVHVSPLGCKHAHTAGPKGLPRSVQPFTPHKCRCSGHMPFEATKGWDNSLRKGRVVGNDMVPELKLTAYGCPQISMAIGLEGGLVYWIHMDADHLYICHGSDLTILSF